MIIETPAHEATASTLSIEEFNNILLTYRQRMQVLKQDKRFHYISIFKNYGEIAGASLEHPHSQLIALPVVPKQPLEALAGAQTYFNYKERCIYCDIIRQELLTKDRVVAENGDFIAIEPFAPRFPFETWVLPLKHYSAFEETPLEKFPSLAELFSCVLKKINNALSFPPFNYMLHTSPLDRSDTEYDHWHFEIIPRLTKVAGFEWGSMAGLDYSHVREPDFNPESLRQSGEITKYIRETTKDILDLWKKRESFKAGIVKGAKYARRNRNIYYDTDGIREQQEETVRVCDDCGGFIAIDSMASTGNLIFAVIIPSRSCDLCRLEGERTFGSLNKAKLGGALPVLP